MSKDLFGNEINPADLIAHSKGGPRKSELAHKALLQLYGSTPGKKCKGCKWFYFRVFSKKYPKCHLSGLDGSTQNHDWSSRWQACGKYEEETE